LRCRSARKLGLPLGVHLNPDGQLRGHIPGCLTNLMESPAAGLRRFLALEASIPASFAANWRRRSSRSSLPVSSPIISTHQHFALFPAATAIILAPASGATPVCASRFDRPPATDPGGELGGR
jgi:hypothetical protein